MSSPNVFYTLSLVLSLPFLAGSACAAERLGPADERIRQAELKLHASNASYQAYNDLAAALCRKARDTEEPALYEKASQAISESLRLSAANYEARKLQLSVLIGRHDFLRALPLAKELNHKVPDDLAGWAMLTDVNVGLGNYAEAERDAQWVLDLRPGNALGFEKAAELRVYFGDLAGAIEFLDETNRRTSANDFDQRAWLLTEKAGLQLKAGYPKEANASIAQALQQNPDSVEALKMEAQIRSAEGNAEEGLAILRRCYERVPSTANLYLMAEAFDKAGHQAEATAAFQKFSMEAESGLAKPENPTVALILYKLDRTGDKAGALTLASKRAADRSDCATLDAFAWALYKNGRYQDAKIQMERGLAVGIREPLYFCHASQIADRVNDAVGAAKYSKEMAGLAAGACPVDKRVATGTEPTK